MSLAWLDDQVGIDAPVVFCHQRNRLPRQAWPRTLGCMTSIDHERFSDRLLQRRIVLMSDEVNDESASAVIARLLVLSADDPVSDIFLYINSPGGSFTAMMAIYDTMQFVAPDVATLCVGQASSSSAVLLAAGASGKRLVLDHARILLHQPHIEGRRGALSDLALEAVELTCQRDEVDGVLARHTGRTVDELRRDTDRALVLVGPAAVDYGIVDAVAAPLGSEQSRVDTALRPGDGQSIDTALEHGGERDVE